MYLRTWLIETGKRANLFKSFIDWNGFDDNDWDGENPTAFKKQVSTKDHFEGGGRKAWLGCWILKYNITQSSNAWPQLVISEARVSFQIPHFIDGWTISYLASVTKVWGVWNRKGCREHSCWSCVGGAARITTHTCNILSFLTLLILNLLCSATSYYSYFLYLLPFWTDQCSDERECGFTFSVALYYVVLCRVVFNVLHCITLHCIRSHCIFLNYIASNTWHCSALHCIVSYHIALHCTALHRIALQCIALCCSLSTVETPWSPLTISWECVFLKRTGC